MAYNRREKMKKNQNTKQTNRVATNSAGVSTAHKVWGIIALAGLFACGLCLGWALRPCATCTMDDLSQGGFVEVIQMPAQTPEQESGTIQPTCQVIENILIRELRSEESSYYIDHLSNAHVYSKISDHGCAEKADMYKALALREINIATALQEEEDMSREATEIVIDTYKKLDMQREAQAFLNKIQQLTDPAIEFILKMDKVINE